VLTVFPPADQFSSVASRVGSAPRVSLNCLPERAFRAASVAGVMAAPRVPPAAGRLLEAAALPARSLTSFELSLTTLTAYRGCTVSMVRFR